MYCGAVDKLIKNAPSVVAYSLLNGKRIVERHTRSTQMTRKLHQRTPQELEALIQYLQKSYADALQQDNLTNLIEFSGGVSVAYSSIDCKILADKWMDEYILNLERLDPTIKARIQTIRDMLPN